MGNVLQSRVPATADGALLVDWLAARFTYFDAAAWRAQVTAGRVLRNQERANVHDQLCAGDHVAFVPAPAPATDVPVVVLHADDDLVAVDKPPHLVAHRDGAFAQNTFLHALERRIGAESPLHLVHRLDRETSGVLLLARSANVVTELQRQFAQGNVVKEYVALVHGCVAADRFTVDAPIGAAGGTIAARRAVVAADIRGARAAVTEAEVIRHFAAHTLLRVRPRTGRTHQIRVHLDHAGHPLVGDKLYGQSDARYLDYVRHLKAGGDPSWPGQLLAGRQMLHASRLQLRHPRHGRDLALEAPTPADLRAAIDALGPAD